MQGSRFKILLIADDTDDRFFIDEAFKRIGYQAQVKKFFSGKELMQYLEQIDAILYPSLIGLDDKPPVTYIDYLLTSLKSNPAYQSIPIVVFAGIDLPGRKKKLLSMGAYDYIEKPASVEEIVNIAKKLKKLAESHTKRSK